MFKNILPYAVLAATFANGVPVVDPHKLDARDILSLDERDVDIAAREISPRAATNLTGFADFERAANVSGTNITEIGYYGGLFYRGIAAATTAILPALQPRSPVNVAAFGGVTTSLNSNAFITARFQGSRTQTFGASSFFFGCTGADTSVAVTCRLAVAGYDNFNRLLGYQTFFFYPSKTSPNALSPAVLSSGFGSGLTTIRLATQYDGNVAGSTAFDNLRYSIIQDIDSSTTTASSSSSSTSSTSSISSTLTSSASTSSTHTVSSTSTSSVDPVPT